MSSKIAPVEIEFDGRMYDEAGLATALARAAAGSVPTCQRDLVDDPQEWTRLLIGEAMRSPLAEAAGRAITQLLASDVRAITDGGGKVRAALNAIDGADRVAHFLVDVTRKRPDAWWREDFRMRFALVNGLPGVVVDSPEGPVQTTAFEIEDDVVKAIYVVRNPDKLRHLAVGTTRER